MTNMRNVSDSGQMEENWMQFSKVSMSADLGREVGGGTKKVDTSLATTWTFPLTLTIVVQIQMKYKYKCRNTNRHIAGNNLDFSPHSNPDENTNTNICMKMWLKRLKCFTKYLPFTPNVQLKFPLISLDWFAFWERTSLSKLNHLLLNQWILFLYCIFALAKVQTSYIFSVLLLKENQDDKSLKWFDLYFYICSNNNFTFALNNGAEQSFQRAVSLSGKIKSTLRNEKGDSGQLVGYRKHGHCLAPETDVRSIESSSAGGCSLSLEKNVLFQT